MGATLSAELEAAAEAAATSAAPRSPTALLAADLRAAQAGVSSRRAVQSAALVESRDRPDAASLLGDAAECSGRSDSTRRSASTQSTVSVEISPDGRAACPWTPQALPAEAPKSADAPRPEAEAAAAWPVRQEA